MDTKVCTKCRQSLPLEEFTRSRRIKSGRIARCKKCVNATRLKKRRYDPSRHDANSYASITMMDLTGKDY